MHDRRLTASVAELQCVQVRLKQFESQPHGLARQRRKVPALRPFDGLLYGIADQALTVGEQESRERSVVAVLDLHAQTSPALVA